MSQPTINNNLVTILIIAKPSEADIVGMNYDTVFNQSNNYTQKIQASIFSMFKDDVYFIKTTNPSRIFRCKYDQIIVQGVSGSVAGMGATGTGQTTGGGTNGTAVNDKNYIYNQSLPSSDVTITHPLNKKPTVQLFLPTGEKIGGDIKQIDNNTVHIHFDVKPFTWYATFN